MSPSFLHYPQDHPTSFKDVVNRFLHQTPLHMHCVYKTSTGAQHGTVAQDTSKRLASISYTPMDNPNLYVKSNELQKRDVNMVLPKFVQLMQWSENELILDLGCGSGDVTKSLLLPLMPDSARLKGLDISKEMVEFAQKKYSDERLQFAQTDILAADELNRLFPYGVDKVFSFYCLHWVQDHRTALKNLFHVLKPNGEALLVFLASHPIFTMYERMTDITEYKTYMKDMKKFISPYQHSIDPASEFANILREVGFYISECNAPEHTFIFENLNSLKNALWSVNPFLPRLPPDLREKYMSDCRKELNNMKLTKSDDRAVVRYRLMVAHVRKPLSDGDHLKKFDTE